MSSTTSRPTKELKTSSGLKYKLYTFISGGEMRKITAIYLEGIDLSVNEAKDQSTKIDASVELKAQDKILELLVCELDGSTEDILKRIMDLPNNETQEILKEASQVQQGLGEKKEGGN